MKVRFPKVVEADVDAIRCTIPPQMSLFGVLPAVEPSRRVQEEQRRLNTMAHAGTSCACCGQRVQIYRRTLYAAMARWLIRLAKLGGGTDGLRHWVDQTSIRTRGGDYAKLVHWGLVERQEHDPEDTVRRTSGLWRVTVKGLAFARNDSRVPKHALVYLGKCIGFDDTQEVGVIDCLGTKFDYGSLWL